MAVTIQLRRGTAAQWSAANTVLAEGELGYETDTGFIKVGDGATAYNSITSYVVEGSLADLSVGPNAAASGNGGLAYDTNTKTFTYTPPDVPSLETTTSIAKVGNELRYTDEDGGVTSIDLTPYLDDTNLARLVSGEMNPDSYIATFTRDDATTFTVDFAPLLDTGLDGDLTGSVFGDDSTLLVDGVNNIIPAGVISGELADSNVAETNVTQHQAALSITESQISDLQAYLTSYTETNDLTSAVTWANIPDANVPESAVTQHQAALSITESQISDLQSYITADSVDTLTNKSGNISQWTNDSAYLTDITGESLDDLSDVNITTPADGELLMYNGVSWRNQNDLTQKINFLNGAQFRGETAYYWEELSITGSPGHVQTYSMGSANRTGYFYITDMEHDMTINITNHEAVATNRQIFSIVVAVDNNNAFGGKICNAIQIDSVAQTVDWGYGNSAPTGTQGQVDVVEFVVYSTAGVGYTVIGRHWQRSGNDVYLVDGGTATSIYTSGDLELDGGGA